MSRHVIVTGASRGIGAAIASHFLAAGDHVVAFSRSGVAPEGCAASHALDVGDSAAVTEAVKSSVAAFGPLDVVVINAGVTHDGLALRVSDEQWREVLHTNLDGAFYCARAAVAPMVRQRSGSIIFIGSIAPFVGNPGQVNYSAAKAGLVGLARSLAREVAPRSITVNVVAPGLINTDMTSELPGNDERARLIPLGHFGEPDDVAGVVGFLASNHARYVTGAVIAVDGGLAMGL